MHKKQRGLKTHEDTINKSTQVEENDDWEGKEQLRTPGERNQNYTKTNNR